MLPKAQIGQPGRHQEHFSFSYQLLVFFLVSTTPHGWERLASRGILAAGSLGYTGGEEKQKTSWHVPIHRKGAAVLAKILTLGCVMAQENV